MDLLGLRVGNGVDFHKFTTQEGEFELPVGGVYIPFKRQILAHSDGDVVLHSMCDAIFGVLANGNMGVHFSPSNPKWKNAKSQIFLEYALELLTNAKGRLINIDTTLICEEPKIMPHSLKIRENIAKITNINITQISIKAVTSEKMGFLGRGEGIGAITTLLAHLSSF
jgi:2-C-methyl-D-erythritol 2,4-cyclodiphosphate synthase